MSGRAPWRWQMWMAGPKRREEVAVVRYPSRERAQRVADRHFRHRRYVTLQHEITGEQWLRERGQWSCLRPANDAAFLRASGRAP